MDLDMGSYGAYVWPAWGISAVVLGWLVVDALGRARRWRREVERLEQERGR
ncbi:MAG TPA: heme exporter protein CcmD [Caulobacteraceae bacterium]|nr:heme exporter protein CcmD [Caulobacteraceae bacterium]